LFGKKSISLSTCVKDLGNAEHHIPFANILVQFPSMCIGIFFHPVDGLAR